MTEPIRLVYIGRLPRTNTMFFNPKQDYWFREKALKQWGWMPMAATRRAVVTITRVLGRGERFFDDDNFERAFKGARDGLTNKYGCYIVDDSPNWSHFDYHQDETRRHQGPRIEVTVEYTE